MEANKIQIGGTHYKTEYEHWDLAVKIPLNYLEGCTTKHVTRWRKKLGVQDLQKAMHYLNKLMEVSPIHPNSGVIITPERNMNPQKIHNEVNLFAKANNLSYHEKEYILVLCSYVNMDDLIHAHELLTLITDQALMKAAERQEPNVPGTPEDGGHHDLL